MPRDGTGTYNAPESPAVTATPITASGFNATISDIGSALTQSVSRDGQTQPSANLPMNTFRHTNVGNAAARNEYATLGQVQDGAALYAGVAGGTADAITISLSPAITAYAAGQSFRFVANATNTGAVTLSVNGLSAATVAKGDGLTALAAGDIPADHLVTVQHDGVRFRLGGVQSALGATLAAAATPAAARTTLAAPALPTATPGAGAIALINPGVNTAFTVPAGGTWLVFQQVFNASTSTYSFAQSFSIEAGGTVIAAPGENLALIGWAWRVA